MSKHDKTIKGAWPATLMKMERQGDTLKTERRQDIMKRNTLPMNLQHFAEGDGQPAGAAGTTQGTGQQPGSNTEPAGGTQPAGTGQQAVINYDRIQEMLNGTIAAKEKTALKAYFKEQGLSQEEAEQAIAAFKAEKASREPDVNALQAQLAQEREAAMRANVEKEAMFLADEIGVELGTMPYLLRLADLSKVTDDAGQINKEELKAALNKILEELPQLKPDREQQQNGFRQIGSGGQQGASATEDQLAGIFGNNKEMNK